jgi:hypothetical protein
VSSRPEDLWWAIARKDHDWEGLTGRVRDLTDLFDFFFREGQALR